ncbi:MAG: hypothetical protein HKM88_02900 [Halobacteria archaeon]|nr:hypothetical protein [Halobacteria archaeon]
MKISNLIRTTFLVFALGLSGLAAAGTPVTENGVTTINLDEYNGYFSASETLASLKPGKYRIKVTNKANKVVGFLLQDGVTHEQLEMFPLDPGQTRETLVTISENGFRYRCPINPTPWYDVAVSK